MFRENPVTVGAAVLWLLAAPAFGITTYNNPNDFIVAPGTAFDGVAKLFLTIGPQTFGCTGALLPNGIDVLTAAHCLTGQWGGRVGASTMRAQFSLANGVNVEIAGTRYFVSQAWNGDYFHGGDIGIIRLEAQAPMEIPRYEINRTGNEVRRVGTMLGYGISGTGSTGYNEAQYPFGTLRAATNRYDGAGSDIFSNMSSSVLLYDFDNYGADGMSKNDFLGSCGLPCSQYPEIPWQQGFTAPGDDGGPTFIDGEIVGVHSFNYTAGCPTAAVCSASGAPISSFGELAGDTRVSAHAAWIDSIGATLAMAPSETPEPGTAWLLAAALLGVIAARRQRR